MRKTFEVNLERLRLRGGKARKNQSLFSFVLAASLVLHALVIVAFAMVVTVPGTSAISVRAPLLGVVQATAVSAVQVERWQEQKEAEKRRLQEEKMTEQRERERIARKRREAQEAERARKSAAKREAGIIKRKQEVAEAKRNSEVAAEARRKAEKAREKAAAEARRKAEEARVKVAAEVRRKAEEARVKAAAEASRKAEEAKAKVVAEARRKAEEAKAKAAAKAQAEHEVQLRAEAEARRSRELVLLVNKYIRDIENKIRSVWSVPPGGIGHGDCTIRLEQDRSGGIRSVQIQTCEGNQLYRRSLEEAVLKAAPLPLPGSADIFDAEVEVTFRLQ